MTINEQAGAIDAAFIAGVRGTLQRQDIPHFIGGKFAPGIRGETFETLDPSTNQSLARVHRGQADDVREAVKAARQAFEGAWRRTRASERRRHLLQIARLIEAHADELAVIECLDAGQVLRIVRAQVSRAAENFSFYADYAGRAMDGRTYPVDSDWINYTVRVPVGVCGIITPWNAPLMLSTWRIAPALAAGNTVVLKPAEWSPLTAWKLAEIVAEADLPPGVFNVVQGYGEEAGAPLVSHPDVPLICLTGETTTGTAVMRNGAAGAQASVSRTWRQESGDRLRRCGSRSRARCRGLSDLQLQRRALHGQLEAARPAGDLRAVHGSRRGACGPREGGPSARADD